MTDGFRESIFRGDNLIVVVNDFVIVFYRNGKPKLLLDTSSSLHRHVRTTVDSHFCVSLIFIFCFSVVDT